MFCIGGYCKLPGQTAARNPPAGYPNFHQPVCVEVFELRPEAPPRDYESDYGNGLRLGVPAKEPRPRSEDTEGGACVHRAAVLPPSDIARIIDELWEPYKTMITLIAPTGMRESELLALSWEDIDFDRALIRARRSYYRGEFGPPKTG